MAAVNCEAVQDNNLNIKYVPAKRVGPNYELSPVPEGDGRTWVDWLNPQAKSIKGKESVNDKGQGLFLSNDPNRPFVFDLHLWSSTTHQRQAHLWRVPDTASECKVWLNNDDGIEFFHAQEIQVPQ